MYEVLNAAVGVVIAMTAQRIIYPRLRAAVLVLSSIAVGALVSIMSGELFTSWTYLPIDIAQVLLVAGATTVLYNQWQSRHGGLHKASKKT